MATYDAWGGSWGSSWGLSWTRTIPTPPTPPVFTPDTGVGGKRTGTRTRRGVRILLRIDGQEYEVSDLAKALAAIKAAKDAVPEVARETAMHIVATGKRIGDAKRDEEESVQLIEAPSSVRSIIEDRIAEMQRLHWRLVQARLKELDDDDNDVLMIL